MANEYTAKKVLLKNTAGEYLIPYTEPTKWGEITGTLSNQTDLQTALDAKQGTVSDLETIRSNAEAGKAASDTISGYGNIVTHNVAEFATAAQGALADSALQPNDNVSELTNDAGYITSAYHDDTKQDVLTAGSNIQITNNTISATDTTYTAGNGLTLTGTEFSANVVNNVTSTSTTDALSANMGKELQDEIDNLKARGRYLSQWNATTGLPATQPTTLPYAYKSGDYFIVGTVGETNYKPSGSEYTGAASTTVETGTVAVEDVYYFDSNVWHLQQNAQRTVSFASLVGQPTDNTNLATALNAKQDASTAVTHTASTAAGSATLPVYVATDGTATPITSYEGNAATATKATQDASGNVITSTYATKTEVNAKQDTLTAGDNIQITNNTISATDTTYTAGDGIKIEGTVISNTRNSAVWGNITGTLSEQTDLNTALAGKQATISDLETIRSNASAGKSASDTIATYGNIVTHNTSEFATAAQGSLADSAIQPNDNISELTNDAGYITGITSSDVTTALGYTPYNSTNPNKYQTDTEVAAAVAGKIDKVETLPTASASNLGLIVQYVGATTEAVTNAYFYKCVQDGENYVWQNVQVQDAATVEDLNYTISTISPSTTNFVEGTTYSVAQSIQRTANLFAGYKESYIDTIDAKIPTQASSTNQLADKAFVNSSIAASAANFRGNWATWDAVPTDSSLYPADSQGSRIPTNNDYLVVQDATGYGETYTGAWRFLYIGTWATDGKNGWNPSYRIGSAFTSAQQASLDSGATSTLIAQISTNATNIGDLQTDKLDKVYTAGNKVYGTNNEGAQVTYTAGDNIQMNEVTVGETTTYNISATDTTYTAGDGIKIENNVISNTRNSAVWGNITGTLSSQTDLQTALNGKQDTISDLATIRSNAEAGKSASDTISGYGNIVTHNVSEFATAAQGDLADSALQPNDNISELTNDAGYTTNVGTITGITMNGSSKGTSGVVDLGTVITDVSGKQDKLTAGDNIQITGTTISATDTTYTAGNGLTLTGTEFSANVTNNVTSTSTTNALSANMGKELQDQIDNLKARGRYLSQWNAATGLAATAPTTLPYAYKAGDYFIVGTVGETNYKPSGSEYTGTASTTVETAEVAVEDVYYYDGNVWHLQQNTQKTVSFANLSGQPTDNTNLASALNAKYDASNPAGYTSNVGTITGITMNGASKGTSGVVDLGTVITDISGKQDLLTAGTNISIINNVVGTSAATVVFKEWRS